MISFWETDTYKDNTVNNTQATIYIESKIDGKRYCKDNGHFTKHLRKHNMSYQQYYETHVTGIEEKCVHCGCPKTFYQKSESYATTCGAPVCVGKEISLTKQNWTDDQRISDSDSKKLALSSRTGAYYENRKLKITTTSLKKYGTEYPTQSEEFKNKSKKSKLEKYGNEYYAGWEKSAKKNRSKTVKEQDAINNTRRKTNMELFGVGCSFLRPDAISNSRRSNSLGKEYTLPSGKIVGIRGYENLALDVLFKQGYAEESVLMHDKLSEYILPVFDYVNVNEHLVKYYPDIYIPEENKIIEVKSRWWWDGYGNEKYAGRLINNQRKAASVIKSGYKYEVWLFDDKKEYTAIKYE